MKKQLLCLVLATAGLARVASAQMLDATTTRRIDSVFAEFDHTDRPGCSLAVGRHGRLVYERGYGMSNLEYGIAIEPRSIFHVASISKQFTAFSVGLLADQGKLSLDDDVRKFIPELPDYGTPITLRHLMHHTSGLRDQWELLGWAGWRDDDVITEDDILGIVTRQKALNFTPGAEYLYSNSGYTLLAIVVKRVSGLRLREFAEANIFKPLGMSDTHFHNDHTMIVPHRTSAYQRRAEGGWKISIPVFDNDGATSLQTTAADLLKWERNFTTGVVGSRKLIDEAQVSAKLSDGTETHYGFGLSLETFRGLATVGHGGADAGYRAHVFRFPAETAAVAVACNFAEAVPSAYAEGVAAVLLQDKLGPAPTAAVATAAQVKLSTAELDAVAGAYRSDKSDEASLIVRKDSTLVLTSYGVPLVPLGPRRFTFFGVIAEFTDGTSGGAPGLVIKRGDQVLARYVRAPGFAPDAAALAAFTGTYWSDELEASYRIVLADGKLRLERKKNPSTELVPVYTDAFTADVGTLRFARKGGKVTGFALTGGRVRRVGFVRVAPDGATRR